MGPTVTGEDHKEPFTLQGNLSSEELPARRAQNEVKEKASPSGPNLGDPETDKVKQEITTTRKDVETDVNEGEIAEAQYIANLQERIKDGDDTEAKFEYGQFYFRKRDFAEARKWFEEIEDEDMQAKYQLAVMYYDGLGVKTDYQKAVKMMKSLADNDDPEWMHLVPAAQYNLGRAYFQGYGVPQSDVEAETLWILAAKDGDPSGSVKAQSTLGMFYSREGEAAYDMKKAHFWHQEATGNGSLESQAALGILYHDGNGVEQDPESSFQCFKHAAERGNVYAIGHMAYLYYRQKLFNNAVDFAQRVVCITDPERVAEETGCLLHYVKKGIALSAFVYGRCLDKGYGVQRNKIEARKQYLISTEMDLDLASHMQDLMILGHI